MERYTYVGKTEEEALEEALKELDVTKEDIMYKSNEQKGGLFKSKKVELEVIKKSDIHDFIKETILKITKDMGFEVTSTFARQRLCLF